MPSSSVVSIRIVDLKTQNKLSSIKRQLGVYANTGGRRGREVRCIDWNRSNLASRIWLEAADWKGSRAVFILAALQPYRGARG